MLKNIVTLTSRLETMKVTEKSQDVIDHTWLPISLPL